MTQQDWDTASAAAMDLFAFGQQEAAKQGLLLVDTKYEFGKDADGNILLIDEIHTPDSSRFWVAKSYDERHANGKVRTNLPAHAENVVYSDSHHLYASDHSSCNECKLRHVSFMYKLKDTISAHSWTVQEPENIDKEFLRLWFRDNCDPYKDATLPDAPVELVCELSARYIHLFETITGTKFCFADVKKPVHDRIEASLAAAGIISAAPL